ncbi:efflux RND transporter permease subunit [Nannocystis sp.]|uniref:efflux RND transporter permease subunit n=1 Tax=Nannocystis sp. TaxID=1962667 RepID=UPI0025DC333F|nr:efflux RND transporter permease subunit [Nannocystis sp.]MBK7824114.1 efflux RND transporter permease subunit [Nannocystis sp.]
MSEGGLVSGAVRRPVTTTMVMVAIVVFGLVALTRLPVALLPDLSYPSVTIRSEYVDAAPSEVEELITRPVEELVGAVPGVVRVESVSREGLSEVVLDFGWGTDIDRSLDDVREKLDRAVLPIGALRPVVLRYDPAQEPILRLALVGGPGARGAELYEHAERLVQRALEKLPGVAAVQLHGGDKEEVRVELDPARLAAHALTADEVAQAIRRDNVNRPGGALTDQRSRYLVRTVHEARTPEALREVIVRSRAGAELRLGEVARVSRAPLERSELSRVAGREAVELAVYREGDANTVAVANEVLAGLPSLRLMPGESVEVLSNQSSFIESAIAEVQANTLLGGLLAVLVLLFFLRDLRATAVIAVSIPISLLATFVPLQLLGVSLNLMSLGGLALGVGMLVDNSIVVLESIARVREREVGAGLAATAVRGTVEVAASVVASTLTTVAVFLPMAFVEGVAGHLVRDLSYAVSFSILSSMVVSLTLVPVLQSLGGAGEVEAKASPRGRLAGLVGLLAIVPALLAGLVGLVMRGLGRVLSLVAWPLTMLYAGVERLYPALLRVALKVRVPVLLAALGLCVGSVELARGLGRTLLPELQQGEFFVQLALPQGSALDRSAALAGALAEAVKGDARVAQVFARVGSMTAGDSATGTIEGTHLAQVNVRLQALPPEQGAVAEAELFTRMQAALREPEASARLGRPALFSFDAPIEVQVFSDEPARAVAHARRLLPDLRAIAGLADVVPDDLAGRPEVRVDFDRERLSRLGLAVDTAALAVQRAIQGEVATKMHAADRQLDVRVQLPRVDRTRVEDVGRVQVAVQGGVPVLLSAVAELTPAIGPAEIRHIEGRRGLRIRARLAGADLGRVAAEVQAVLDRHATDDPRVQAAVGGQASEMGASLDSLLFAAVIAVFLIYVVMASSFESLHHPLLIMGTVPLALIGVSAACVLTGTPISAMVGIGAIILGGIVVNNAIVLVNTVNYARGQGMAVDEALIHAGRLRLRPIVMTTATTVLGLLPMAIGLGDGAALRQPLAIAVIGGLVASTALTLVVIPCAYSLVPGRRRAAWAALTGEG